MRTRGINWFLVEALCALILFCAVLPVHADTHTWNGPADGLASVDANWLPATAPAAGDDVVLNGTSTSDLIWDLDVVLSSWAQTIAYTGTVTVQTTYSGSFQALQTTGDMIISGGALSHSDNSDTQTYLLRLQVGGSFNLDSGASIDLTGLGYDRGEGPGTSVNGGGGTYGGQGQPNETVTTYGSLLSPTDLGSGGNVTYGTPGGGAFILDCSGIATVNGTIAVNGEDSNRTGSGGSVFITTSAISGAGSIQARGGSGSNGTGGGGRISIVLTGDGADFASFSGAIDAYGGLNTGGGFAGGPGTIYLETPAQGSGAGALIIDNNNLPVYYRPHALLPNSTDLNSFSEVIIQNNGILRISSNHTVDFSTFSVTTDPDDVNETMLALENTAGVTFPAPFVISGYTLLVDYPFVFNSDVVIAPDGAISHSQNRNADTYRLNLTINGDLTINSGGEIDVSGKGLRSGGAGVPASSNDGPAHGGLGGDRNGDGISAATYGSVIAPEDLGSGGPWSDGGGAVRLVVSGETRVDGVIAANGGFYTSSTFAAGSGGSVYLTSSSITGAGTISANGGGSVVGTAGGGGRVAVILSGSGEDFSGFTGSVTALGGDTGVANGDGGAGTVYLQSEPQGAGGGDLIIDNTGRDISAAVETVLHSSAPTSVSVGTLTVSGEAVFRIPSNNTLTLGSTGNTLLIASGSSLINEGELEVGGTAITNGGTLQNLSGSLVKFTGQADDSPVAIPGDDEGIVYENLEVDNASTVFNAISDLTVNDDLSITNGTLDLDGNGLSAHPIDTVFFNDGTFALNGNEIVSNLQIDTDSGTVLFKGIADAVLPAFAEYFNLSIDESGTSDPVFTLPSIDVLVHGVVDIADGTLRYSGANSLRINDEDSTSTALNVGSEGSFVNTGTGDLVLGASVQNAGAVSFASSDQAGDGIAIQSTTSTRRMWQGSGSFSFSDVSVANQEASASSPGSITVQSSSDGGGNLNWLFPGAGSGLTGVVVAPGTNVASSATQSAIEFTLTNAWVSNGRLRVTFPAGFDVSGVTAAVSASQVDGDLTVSVSGQDVIVTRSSGTNIGAGTTVDDLNIGPIVLPSSFGISGTFPVVTLDGIGTVVDSGTAPGVTLIQYFTISGAILDGGNPLSGVAVDAGAIGSTTTNASGIYSFPGVVNGTSYSLTPSVLHYSYSPVSASGTVGGDVVQDFTAIIDTHSISGRVMSEDGPVEGVAVNGGLLGVRATDAGGYYSFAGVPYGSSYTITPQSGGWTFAPVSHSGTLSNDLNFDFNATSTAGETTSFGGIVTRDGETPVADALVTLFTEVGSEMVVAAASGLVYRTTTDLYGRFSFSSIPVGSYSFTAEKQGIIITASTVEVSDTSSEVELQTASQSLLSTPAYALWNSFLGMQSVLELQNKTDREVGIRIQLLNSVSGIVSPNTHFVTVAGNQKLDVLLSALDGYSENAYGLIRIESESSFFDGGVSVYRPSDDSAGSFDFGFYVPLVNSVVGTSYVHYNTFYPGASADSVVFNWLTIANPSDEAAEFRVTYYDDRGVVQEETLYTVSAQSRVDADGGHGVRGASRAGLIKITPLNVSVPYYSLQTRYGYNSALRHYEFAGASHSQSANGAEQFIPVTSLQNMNSYLEVGNTSMGRATIELAWLDSQGEAVVEQAYRLGSAATIHVPLLSTVSEGFSGMLRLRSEGSAICAQSLNYQFDDSGNVLEATLARPFEGFASTLSGSYNLFLGMRNWLRLFNLSDQASAVLIDFGEDGGELIVNLSAYSRKDIALHEFELSENSYGAFSLQSGRPGALGAEAVRVIQSTSLEHPLQNSLPLR